jgi:hypothetical protein
VDFATAKKENGLQATEYRDVEYCLNYYPSNKELEENSLYGF